MITNTTNTSHHLTNIIDNFIVSLTASGRSDKTREAYTKELQRFIAFTGNIDIKLLNTDLINQFVTSDNVIKKTDGNLKSKTTIGRTKAVLRSFGCYIEDIGIIDSNPARHLKIKRPDKKEPAFFTDSEKKRFIKAIYNKKGKSAERDYIMVQLFFNTGIRISELVGLNVSDVNLNDKKITIKAKGEKVETRFINTKLRQVLKTYLRKRMSIITDSLALFISNQKTRITVRQIDRRFGQWLKWSGINRRLTVHSMRHTFATELYRRTNNLMLVSKALGHRHISTTQIYTHLYDFELEDAIDEL